MEMNKQIIVGDKVKVELVKKDYEGILLESPQDEKGLILLKLNSGYNIGINKKDILNVKLIKKGEDKEEAFELKRDNSKQNIAVIISGGTIASRLDPKTGGVKWLTNPENLFKFYPEIFEKVNVSKVEVPFMKGSEDMDFKDWKKLAKTTQKLLKDLNKPVVLTYSQRSIDRASSDANLNLQCSALAAISDIAEVMLVGHANTDDNFCYAMPGTKVRKLHSSRRDAFKVVNGKEFAKIDAEKNSVNLVSHFRRRNKNKVKVD